VPVDEPRTHHQPPTLVHRRRRLPQPRLDQHLPPTSRRENTPTRWCNRRGAAGRTITDLDLITWRFGPYSTDHANLGLRLPDGIIGIDVDAYGDKQGLRTLADLEHTWGRLPHTWRSTSRWPDDGNSGIRLFRVPPGRAWRNPGDAIEAIHHGWRYLVTWPSRHPDTRRIYCWVNEDTGEVIAGALPAHPSDLPALPSAWVNGLDAGDLIARDKTAAGAFPDEWDHPGTCRIVEAKLAEAHTVLDGDSRHDNMLKPVATLIGHAARGHRGVKPGLDTLGEQYVAVIGETRGRAAVSEWQRNVEGAVGLIKAENPTQETCGGDRCGDPREVPDWITDLANATPPEPALEVRVAEAWEDFARDRLPILDWHALWADETEEEWIIEPLLPARRLVALYSAPKVGKSLLLLEVAAAVAAGNRECLGVQLGPGRVVLYIDFENDPKADVRERLTAMGYGPDNLGNLRYLSFPTLAGLDSPRGADELMAAVHYHGAEVVVIDTVSRAIDGEENENDTWLSFYRNTGLRMKQAQVALIRLDHAGKDETKGQRGGSAKAGDVDAVWRMSKIADTTLKLECEMNRMPVVEKVLTLHREETPDLRHRVDAKGAVAAFHVQLDKWTDVMRAAGLLYGPDQGGIGQKAAYDQLKAMQKAGDIPEAPPWHWVQKVRKAIEGTPRGFDPSAGRED
jgi:hypothetical protein